MSTTLVIIASMWVGVVVGFMMCAMCMVAKDADRREGIE